MIGKNFLQSITRVTTFVSETAWSGSNGGYNLAFNRPSYQNGVQTNTKRGVPDLAAVANLKKILNFFWAG